MNFLHALSQLLHGGSKQQAAPPNNRPSSFDFANTNPSVNGHIQPNNPSSEDSQSNTDAVQPVAYNNRQISLNGLLQQGSLNNPQRARGQLTIPAPPPSFFIHPQLPSTEIPIYDNNLGDANFNLKPLTYSPQRIQPLKRK